MLEISAGLMWVLAPVSAHAQPSAQPIDTSENTFQSKSASQTHVPKKFHWCHTFNVPR